MHGGHVGQGIESVHGGHVGQGILKTKMIITTVIIVGTLRCESGDTSENVSRKLTSCPAFKIFGLFQLFQCFNRIQ